MHCPECHRNDLKIDVSFSGRVTCKFVDDDDFEVIDRVSLDSQWNDESACECLNCDWNGTVRDAKSAPAAQRGADVYVSESDAVLGWVTPEELRELERLLDTEECSPALRRYVERLIDEVGRLGSLLEMLSRITQGPSASDDDTVIG